MEGESWWQGGGEYNSISLTNTHWKISQLKAFFAYILF